MAKTKDEVLYNNIHYIYTVLYNTVDINLCPLPYYIYYMNLYMIHILQ